MQTKKYNKKCKQNTKNRKNKHKKTKRFKQKGGFRCQQPQNIIIQETRNKNEDLRVNSENYFQYLEKCQNYCECVFVNINNLNLITKILTLLNSNIANVPLTFTYKKIPNTETRNFSDYVAISRNLNEETTTENVNLNTSKFLDIYLTSLLTYYVSYYSTNCNADPDNCDADKIPFNNVIFSDSNTTFLDNKSEKFITDNGIKIIKDKIITFLINLDNKFIIKSMLQIISNTFSILYEDRALIKNSISSIYSNLGNGELSNININSAAIVIDIILQTFLFCFAKYLEWAQEQAAENENSINILKFIYKIAYAIIKNRYLGANKTTKLIENVIPKQFTIGTGSPVQDISKLPIFTQLYTINLLNCIIKTFLEDHRYNTLCRELEEYLTIGTPLNQLATPTYIIAGCKRHLLFQTLSYDLIKQLISYNFFS